MAAEVPFVRVGIMSSAWGHELELVLHGGRLLRFDADVDATKLVAVVTAMEGIAAGAAMEGASGRTRRC
jgi:hypothetical protein